MLFDVINALNKYAFDLIEFPLDPKWFVMDENQGNGITRNISLKGWCSNM